VAETATRFFLRDPFALENPAGYSTNDLINDALWRGTFGTDVMVTVTGEKGTGVISVVFGRRFLPPPFDSRW